MIRKYAGEMEMVCDKCGETGPAYDEDHFDLMVSEAKDEGWRISRTNGHWKHECPSCVTEESVLSAARRKFGLR